LPIFFISCNNQDKKKVVSLNDWQFQYQNEWYCAKVPGSNVTDLLRHQIIEDPYFGTNEDSIQWVFEKNWIYKTTFRIPNKSYSNKEIVFNGLDTYADVYLNDSLVLQTDNMFRKWRLDISSLSKNIEHNLRLVFKPVSGIEEQKVNSLNYELPGGRRVHSRKAGFHYGWDWGAKITPSGIIKDVNLNYWNHAVIRSFQIDQDLLTDSTAFLTAKIAVEVGTEAKYRLELNDNSAQYFLSKGTHQIEIPILINQPKKWWPVGRGNQHLYSFQINLLKDKKIIDSKQKKTGLRTVKLVTDKDHLGNSFYFEINGEPIFMKGANYIPQDHLQDRVSAHDYRSLLIDAKKTNMNMLRVWGGGIYEQDIFYDLCDSLGILVWQDFMFACAMYPSDSAFLNNIKQEAIENVARLSHHPSIVLWCGNNESSEGWQRWGWQDQYNRLQKQQIESGYSIIFDTILPSIVDEYTKIPYWQSSPKFGRGDPKHQFQGDAHYWGVWHDAEPFENFLKKVPRFMSEFGFQSFPSMSTISKFCDSLDFNLESQTMVSHQKHPRGNQLILEYMAREYPIPSSFDKLVYLSQIVQAQGVRMGLEAHRLSQPYCMGTLFWQFNDCWPVASWSSRDYYGNWKALNYGVKEVFASISLSLISNGDQTFNVWAMSDLDHSFYDSLQLNFYDLKGNYIKRESIANVKINQNEGNLLVKNVKQAEKDGFVVAQLKNKKINSHFLMNAKPKDIKLTKPKIKSEWKGNKLHLSSDIAAFHVYLHGIEGHFSHNFFTLLPGQKKQIEFNGDIAQKNKLLIWSLANIYENE
jgi:beta-mannosidase